jgi:cysteine dioxygenase
MPAAHTLSSLLEYLKVNLKGSNFNAHNVRQISKEMEKWFPRPSEYGQYIPTLSDAGDQSRQGYTRNLVFGNEDFDCILMCWPAGSQSTIHDHDSSSCWVTVVEGSVHEVQYALPRLDKQFLEAEQRHPATAVGHCGELKVVNVAMLDASGGVTGTYANNDIGIHRVENRTNEMACTLHVYAPPLRKMKVFDMESGLVRVHVAESRNCGLFCSLPDEGLFDVEAWNKRLLQGPA